MGWQLLPPGFRCWDKAMSGIWEVRVGKSMGSTGYEIRVQGRLLQVFFCRSGEETRQLDQREQREKRRSANRVLGITRAGYLLELRAVIKRRVRR